MGKGYMELNVWIKGYQLSKKIYLVTEKFPTTERFGLVSQMRRSSVSIVANIAEGYGRNHLGEYIQFLSIAMGSSNELEVYLMLSKDLGYLSEKDFTEIKLIHVEVSKMLRSLKLSMEKKKQMAH